VSQYLLDVQLMPNYIVVLSM